MKLTKILAMLLALCMILCCFAACGGASDDEDEDEDEKVEEKDKDKDEDKDEDKDKDDVDLDFDFGIGGKETSVETTAPVDQDPVDVPVEKDSVVGTWESEFDYGALLEGQLEGLNIERELLFPISLEFKANGSLVQKVEMPADSEIKNFAEGYAADMFVYFMNKANFTDAEEFATTNGYDSYADCIEALIEQYTNDLKGQKTNIEAMNTTDRYTYSGGVVSISGGFELEIDLSNSEFTVTDVNDDSLGLIYKNLVFKKQ